MHIYIGGISNNDYKYYMFLQIIYYNILISFIEFKSKL